jgi:hypothetical protein
MKRAAQSRPNRSGHRSNFGAASARNHVRAAHNDGNSRSTAPTSPSNWHRRPYPFPMPRRWLDFLYAHAWLTFALMVTFFLCFGVTSVNLFILLKMNLDLFAAKEDCSNRPVRLMLVVVSQPASVSSPAASCIASTAVDTFADRQR